MNQTERSGEAVRRPSKTRWFNVQTEPPSRPGMYERSCIGYKQSVRFPSDDWLNNCKYCMWRGLTSPSADAAKPSTNKRRSST